MFLSEFYIAHEAHHNCSGKDCPICRVILICQTFLHTLIGGLLHIAISTSLFRKPRSFVLKNRTAYYIQTLVSLKMKISS
jgi:hypothetical protein